jgi:hypothetical protein
MAMPLRKSLADAIKVFYLPPGHDYRDLRSVEDNAAKTKSKRGNWSD